MITKDATQMTSIPKLVSAAHPPLPPGHKKKTTSSSQGAYKLSGPLYLRPARSTQCGVPNGVRQPWSKTYLCTNPLVLTPYAALMPPKSNELLDRVINTNVTVKSTPSRKVVESQICKSPQPVRVADLCNVVGSGAQPNDAEPRGAPNFHQETNGESAARYAQASRSDRKRRLDTLVPDTSAKRTCMRGTREVNRSDRKRRPDALVADTSAKRACIGGGTRLVMTENNAPRSRKNVESELKMKRSNHGFLPQGRQRLREKRGMSVALTSANARRCGEVEVC